jgi:competence CoiA-like predicted nuclease
MTALALIDGQRVTTRIEYASDHIAFCDTELVAKIVTRQELPTCPGCAAPFILKRYPFTENAYHFAHHPGTAERCRIEFGGSNGESIEHENLKAQIFTAAKAAGLGADVEVQGEGCRADVVIDDGTKRVPFEIQRSTITSADVVERTSRL